MADTWADAEGADDWQVNNNPWNGVFESLVFGLIIGSTVTPQVQALPSNPTADDWTVVGAWDDGGGGPWDRAIGVEFLTNFGETSVGGINVADAIAVGVITGLTDAVVASAVPSATLTVVAGASDTVVITAVPTEIIRVIAGVSDAAQASAVPQANAGIVVSTLSAAQATAQVSIALQGIIGAQISPYTASYQSISMGFVETLTDGVLVSAVPEAVVRGRFGASSLGGLSLIWTPNLPLDVIWVPQLPTDAVWLSDILDSALWDVGLPVSFAWQGVSVASQGWNNSGSTDTNWNSNTNNLSIWTANTPKETSWS